MQITVMLKSTKQIVTVSKDSVKPWDTLALCPISGCGGVDSCYCVDDLTYHRCDKCGCKWSSYDPYNAIEECLDITVLTKVCKTMHIVQIPHF